MSNRALRQSREGRSQSGVGETRGGRVWTSLMMALLLFVSNLGVSSVWAQTPAIPSPSLPSLPPVPSAGVPSQPASPKSTAPVFPSTGKSQILPASPIPVQPGSKGQPGKALPQPTELPKPSPVLPFGPNQIRMQCLPGQPGTVGSTPFPSKEMLKKHGQYIKDMVDTQATLDLVVGQTRLMVLKQAPTRVQIANDGVAGYTVITPTQLSLIGKTTGVTVLTMWFKDATNPAKEEILSYHLRVFPDPEAKKRLEMVYDALSKEINCLFPDSNICLKLVGDKIAVTGFAHDTDQAAKILQIVRANAPDPRDSRPPSAKVPFDRIQGAPLPGEVRQGDTLPLSVENYETMGGPYIINLLKVSGEQQVMLRVTVAEVNRSAARSIGLNFTIANEAGMAVFANNTGLIGLGGAAPSGGANGTQALRFITNTFGNTFGIAPFAGFPSGAGGFNNLPAALDNGQIRLAISALRSLNYARSLAEPTLTTMNGQTATFQAGGQFPVPIVSGYTFAGLQGVSFVPYGVQLSFTPFISDRDRIRLVMAAEVSSRDLAAGATNIGGAAVPSLTSRNFQTTVELREGQTLAVAGLIQNNLGADASRIPLLGDIPVLNRLFGFDRITAGEQELVVLITPELVHPMEHNEVPPLPGSDLFEPTDLEFYVLGRIESHFPVDYRSPVRNDHSRIHQFHQMESLYLFGPHGQVQDYVPPH